jgi:hypothetical protein
LGTRVFVKVVLIPHEYCEVEKWLAAKPRGQARSNTVREEGMALSEMETCAFNFRVWCPGLLLCSTTTRRFASGGSYGVPIIGI